jgi:hypothetical protein
MLKKKDKMIELNTVRVAAKTRKGDIMILTADTSNMDEEVKAVHMFFPKSILQEMGICQAAATSTQTRPSRKPRR